MNLYSSVYSFQYILRQKIINRYYRNSPKEFDQNLLKNPKIILVICTGLLGDSVMSSPVFFHLRQIYPKAKIIFLGKKNNCELFFDCPYIDEYKITPIIPFTLIYKLKERILLEWVKSKNIDIAVVLLGAQFGKILKDAKIPIRVCTNIKGAYLPNLYTHLYESATPKDWGPNEQLNSLRCLGHIVPFSLPKLWTNDLTNKLIKSVLVKNNIQEEEKFIILHPFGSSKRQWWDTNNIKILSKELYNKFKIKTILIGGIETMNLIAPDKYLLDLTGKVSIGELISLIYLAEILITTDSGPFHIAGALNKNIIGLFRSSRPEFAKLYPKTKIILGYNEFCLKKCNWDTCINEKCYQMHEITPCQVISSISSFLKSK